MTDKEIIIDVHKCKYRDTYTNLCLAERDNIGETYCICTGTNCYYKQLASKTEECKNYKQALEEIKHWAYLGRVANRKKEHLQHIFQLCQEVLND